jgi:cell division protein FtsX
VNSTIWSLAESLSAPRLVIATAGSVALVCYVSLIVINLVWALFILNGQVSTSTTGTPLHAAEYWTLSWFFASVATVGGALGSGLESDEAIRAAAYSKREQERRHMLQDDDGDQLVT